MCISNDFEEEYKGYIIYVESNPDPYRDDLLWEITIDNGIWDGGSEYSLVDCLKSAKEAVDLRINRLAGE